MPKAKPLKGGAGQDNGLDRPVILADDIDVETLTPEEIRGRCDGDRYSLSDKRRDGIVLSTVADWKHREGDDLRTQANKREHHQARVSQRMKSGDVTPRSLPETSAGCPGDRHSCAYFSCRHNLRLEVGGRSNGSIYHNPHGGCALDYADSGPMTLEEIGYVMGITRERVRQIEAAALRHLKEAGLNPDEWLEGREINRPDLCTVDNGFSGICYEKVSKAFKRIVLKKEGKMSIDERRMGHYGGLSPDALAKKQAADEAARERRIARTAQKSKESRASAKRIAEV